MKRLATFFVALVTVLTGLGVLSPLASASYNSALLISDGVFRDSNSMSAGDIQNFLNGKNSGLQGYKDTEDCGATNGAHYSFYASYYHCGQYVSAAQIIYDAAQAYGISPRVILATTQKEESLVTTPNPTSSQLNYAMGYGCPDSTGCSGYTGFFNQIDNGTWQFRTDYELASGNSYWGYPSSSYPCNGATRYYTAALRPGNSVGFKDDAGTIYQQFVIPNASTATFYCYTPHAYPGSSAQYFSGSYWFVYYFEQWWGSTTDPCGTATISNLGSGSHPSKNGDYNGDNRTDATVYRPADGCWHVHGVGDAQFGGQSGDIPVPGDYNGDGQTDIAVYRPVEGGWHIRGIGDFSYGASGDIPVPGDYNGDGKTDIAVYRPSDGSWHIRGIGDYSYGKTGDIPVPGDYNGDGRADIAVYRPSEGVWHIRGVGDYAYGTSSDIPAQADYNGDGRTDIAIYRQSEGGWHIRGIGDYSHGASLDIPVPGDYNGDGRADIAVYRPSEGGWHIRAVGDFGYGTSSDIPATQTLNARLLNQYGLISGF